MVVVSANGRECLSWNAILFGGKSFFPLNLEKITKLIFKIKIFEITHYCPPKIVIHFAYARCGIVLDRGQLQRLEIGPSSKQSHNRTGCTHSMDPS